MRNARILFNVHLQIEKMLIYTAHSLTVQTASLTR